MPPAPSVDERAGRRRPGSRLARHSSARPATSRVARLGEGHSNLTYAVRPAGSSGCCAARRPARCCRRRTTWCASTACWTCWPAPSSRCACRGRSRSARTTDVLGAPFYLMEQVAGVVVRDTLPGWLDQPAPARPRARPRDRVRRDPPGGRRAVRRRRARPAGRLPGAAAAPVDRAARGDPGRGRRRRRHGPGTLPDYDAVRDWLAAHLPDEAEPAVVHGDAKLDNVVGRPGRDAGASPRSWTGRWPPSATRAPTSATCCPSGRSPAADPPAGPAGHRRRRVPDPRRAGRDLGAGHRPGGGRPDLVRHAGDLEARGPARGVLPPAPRRHHRRPVLRHARARRAGPARPRPGDLRCLSCARWSSTGAACSPSRWTAPSGPGPQVDGVDFDALHRGDARVARRPAGRAGRATTRSRRWSAARSRCRTSRSSSPPG